MTRKEEENSKTENNELKIFDNTYNGKKINKDEKSEDKKKLQ